MKYIVPAICAILLASISGTASATELRDERSGCAGENCRSAKFTGTVLKDRTYAKPWTAQIFGGKFGDCVRLEVLSQQTDLEMYVVGPHVEQNRWYDDDSGTCDLCPLIKFQSPEQGWYTVVVSNFAGAPVNADFVLSYGRYPGPNPNCANPTPQNAPATASKKK
jgi:hypothetical protein